MKRNIWISLTTLPLVLAGAARGADIGTAFTYQGSLENGSGPLTDVCDFRFGLWDAAAGGNQVGSSPQTASLVEVADGMFTVTLDFGTGAIDGEARWLAIEVKCTPNGAFVPLDSQRVALNPVPHAVRAVKGVGPPNALEVDTTTGNVGIGTTSPWGMFDVRGDSYFGTGTDNENHKLVIRGPNWPLGSASAQDISYDFASAGSAKVRSYRGNSWDTYLQFLTNGINQGSDSPAVRMHISENGNVGIGTSTPNKRLTVNGDMELGTSAGGFRHLRIGGGNSSGFLYGSFNPYGDGIHMGYNYYANGFGGHVIPDPGRQTSRIQMAPGNVTVAIGGVNAVPSNILRVDSNGIQVNFDILYTGDLLDLSDERLKKNIAPVEDALAKLRQLRGVYFNMKDTPEQRDVGLIAQDVQEVLPEAVRVVEPEGGYLGVSYPSVIPLLVEAIKEQNTMIGEKDCEIGALENEISNLKSQIPHFKELEARLARLEARSGNHSAGEDQP